MQSEPPARFNERKYYYQRSGPKNKPTTKQKQKANTQRQKRKFKELKKKLKARAAEMRENMTDAEKHLWEELRAWPEPYKCSASKNIGKYIVDFVFLKQKIVVEVDGGYHLRPEQRIKDQYRTKDLNHYGFKVVRFSNDDVLYNRTAVIESLKAGIYPQPVQYRHSLLLAAMQPGTPQG